MITRIYSLLVVLWSACAATCLSRADDTPEWVQVHADIEYVRTGTSSTSKDGSFTFKLKASLDQLMVRVAPDHKGEWAGYVLLDEYPKAGKISGSATMVGAAKMDQYSASANLGGSLSSLDSVWIESVRPQPILAPGLIGEIRVAAKMQGSVKCDLPGDASDPRQAIFIWPTPMAYKDEVSSFVAEGTLNVFPTFGPRPKGEQEGMMYDLLKASTNDALPGVGGLTAPSTDAKLTGTPDQWELTLVREAKPDLTSGGEYSHRVAITLRLVPRTLPIPKPLPGQ